MFRPCLPAALRTCRAEWAASWAVLLRPATVSRSVRRRRRQRRCRGLFRVSSTALRTTPGTASRNGPENASTLRVLNGPQATKFADAALETLLSEPYVVSTESSRMGFRLVGSPLRPLGSADMLSDATPLGALQVLPSGQPCFSWPIARQQADIPRLRRSSPPTCLARRSSRRATPFDSTSVRTPTRSAPWHNWNARSSRSSSADERLGVGASGGIRAGPRAAESAAGSVHDLSRRRGSGLAARDAQQRRNRSSP